MPRSPSPSSPDERILLRLGAGLADSLAAVRIALELLDLARPHASGDVLRLARSASRRAEACHRALAALARARCLPLPPGASEACTVVRRALARGNRDDRDAGVTVECPGGELQPVAVPVPVLERLFLDWWHGTRDVVHAPRAIRVAPDAPSGTVELRVIGASLVVPRERLEVAVGLREPGPLRSVAVPPGAWFLGAAGVLAGRVGASVLLERGGPVLRLPSFGNG